MGLNHSKIRPLAGIKNLLVTGGRQKREIRAGLFHGLTLEIDLSYETQMLLGLYETETFGFIRSCAARTQWMVDVGAGAGELAVYFLKRSQSKSVYAFEPQRSRTELLELNAGYNLSEREVGNRLLVYNKFVSDKINDDSVALDALNLDPSQRGFLKVDVDGFELEVLRSGVEILKSGNVDILIETHSLELEQECESLLLDLGYKPQILRNAWWRLIIPERRPIEHNRWLVAYAFAR